VTQADGQKPESAKPNPSDWARIAQTVVATVKRLGPAAPLAIISATLPTIGLVALACTFNIIGPWLREQHALGIAIYICGFALSAGLAILPTHLQAALGGWAFGFAVGCPAALVGVLGAALCGYAIALRATGDRALTLIREKPKWQAVYDALLGSGFGRTLLIVILVRLAVTPFALTNLLFAATRVHPLAYALGTLIGIAPRTSAAVFLAVGVREFSSQTAQQRWVWLVGIGLTLVAVVVIGQIANRAVTRVTGSRQGA